MSQIKLIGSLGSCTVCGRDGLRVINTTGLLWNHGPRGNLCTGSHTLPLVGSVINSSQHSTSNEKDEELTFNDINALRDESVPLIKHLSDGSRTMNHIPKGARNVVSSCLESLISEVVKAPGNPDTWMKLFRFAPTCLKKPERGGKGRNLTSSIISHSRAYLDCALQPTCVKKSTHKTTTKRIADDQAVASRASLKLEDGDIKGAIRILCSDDRLVQPDSDTLAKLADLHPKAPFDRRQAPDVTTAPLHVNKSEVRQAILSFPAGSACGLDGLRPQHLKDLITGNSCSFALLEAITDLINIIVAGKSPPNVNNILFGATLLALTKKSGGVRPIAVGLVWRRIAAKTICYHVSPRSSDLFAPRQLGFGIRGGIESAVRAVRSYMENLQPGQAVIKIDFKNAFNTIRRDVILEAVEKYFPEVQAYANASLGCSSHLAFGEFLLASEEGAQQGDPLGPWYFCLAIKDLLDGLNSELVVAYLDDIAIGDSTETLASDFSDLKSKAAIKGLTLSLNKCEQIYNSDVSKEMLAANNVTVPETKSSDAIMLGAPIMAGDFLDKTLFSKLEDLKRLALRLSFMPAHDSLYLLKNIMAAPRLMFLLRASPCFRSPVLEQIDFLIRETTTKCLNIDINEKCWRQASLPVRWGGLGIRDVVTLAPSAFLASAAQTMPLAQSILPLRLHDRLNSHIEEATALWSLVSGVQTTVSLNTQRSFDDKCCSAIYANLLAEVMEPVDRARLLASVSQGSGDWLETIPLSNIGLKMDNDTTRIAVGLRIGAAITNVHTCSCGTTVQLDGRHGLSCRKSAGKHMRHNEINAIIQRAFLKAETPANREPHGLCPNDKRPDGVTLIPWSRGHCLAWDATCPDTFAASHIATTSITAGSAAIQAEEAKRSKYADIQYGIDFVPIAIETSGAWGPQGMSLISEIGKRIAVVTNEPRSATFLRQRLSIALQKGNALCVMATVRPISFAAD
jgi:hypothetical protein